MHPLPPLTGRVPPNRPLPQKTLLAIGSPSDALSDETLARAMSEALAPLGRRNRVLVIPPDGSRAHSQAGLLTRAVWDHYGNALTDVLPALGTHHPMTADRIAQLYAGIPADRFRVHRWRDDTMTVGTIPADEVEVLTDGAYRTDWKAQLNRLIADGSHDLIVSVGQVVPHEVTGFANHAKNLFVGCGGADGINESHYLSAVYGMERVMGRADTPPRRLLNLAMERFVADLPILFALTVRSPARPGEAGDEYGLVTRGLFVGAGRDCFERAADLSRAVNVTSLDAPLSTVVVHLDPHEYVSTWIGNKAVYRSRMALADGGHLIILAPGVRCFGEDAEIDRLIRRYGYRPSAEVQALVREHADLRANLSAAAHLIHGSSEGRFRITWAPGHLSREEIESVGYEYGDLDALTRRYDPASLQPGRNTVSGEAVYYIPNPSVGLWATQERLQPHHREV